VKKVKKSPSSKTPVFIKSGEERVEKDEGKRKKGIALNVHQYLS